MKDIKKLILKYKLKSLLILFFFIFLVWFIISSFDINDIYWNLDNNTPNGDIENSKIKANSIKLTFYDNNTNCSLNGGVYLGDNLMGYSKNGSFILFYPNYENLSYYGEILSISGLTDSCFGTNENLPLMGVWTTPNLKYYFDNNKSPNFVAELTPRSPQYYGEMMGFVRPYEVGTELDKIYLPSDIKRDRIEKIVDYVGGKIRYYSDYTLFKQVEYWQTPLETLQRNEGDCEDWATAILSLILEDDPNAKCYNIILQTHVNIFCYSDGIAGFYDQDKIKSRTSLIQDNEEEDKVRIRAMLYQYFRVYGISPNEQGIYAAFNDKEIEIFENNEEFVDWVYNLF